MPTDIQVFGPDFKNGTVAGTNEWIKPNNFTVKVVEVWLCGGGAGGGSGSRRQISTANAGGGGGGSAGELVFASFDGYALGSAEIVTIGAGGAGGAAVTANNTAGNFGIDGNPSSFGSWITARAGKAPTTVPNNNTSGNGGSLAASGNQPGANSGGGWRNQGAGFDGGFAATNAVGAIVSCAPIGGGGGGACHLNGTTYNGGSGVPTTASPFGSITANNGVAGGTLDAGDAVLLGYAANLPIWYSGGGGGASGPNAAGAAGNGGKGKFGSGGGGGGGKVQNSGGNSGAGGSGGNGYCVVISYG